MLVSCLQCEFLRRALSKAFLPSACHLFLGSTLSLLRTLTKSKVLHTVRILQVTRQVQQTVVANVSEIVLLDCAVHADQFDYSAAVIARWYFAPSRWRVVPLSSSFFTRELLRRASASEIAPINVIRRLPLKSSPVKLHLCALSRAANLRIV